MISTDALTPGYLHLLISAEKLPVHTSTARAMERKAYTISLPKAKPGIRRNQTGGSIIRRAINPKNRPVRRTSDFTADVATADQPARRAEGRDVQHQQPDYQGRDPQPGEFLLPIAHAGSLPAASRGREGEADRAARGSAAPRSRRDVGDGRRKVAFQAGGPFPIHSWMYHS
jgi:hypothetical protein